MIDDELLDVQREAGPQRFGTAQVALDDEHAAAAQAFHRVGVAEHLGISRWTLLQKMKEYGIGSDSAE